MSKQSSNNSNSRGGDRGGDRGGERRSDDKEYHHKAHNRFELFYYDKCDDDEFYIIEDGQQKYFYLDKNLGFFDEYGQYYDADGKKASRPRNQVKKPAGKDYFNSKQVTKSGKSFKIKNSRFRYIFDEDGGWYDEYGYYYNSKGEYVKEGRFSKKKSSKTEETKENDSESEEDINTSRYQKKGSNNRSDSQKKQDSGRSDNNRREQNNQSRTQSNTTTSRKEYNRKEDNNQTSRKEYNRRDDNNNSGRNEDSGRRKDNRKKGRGGESQFQKIGSPDEQLAFILKNTENEERSQDYKKFSEQLKKILAENGWETEIYGSYITNTQQKESDLDLTVLTKERFEQDERSELEKIFIFLQSRLKNLKYEKILGTQVKVPLLSIEDPKKHLQVEITLNNLMGITNSQLLAEYIKFSPQVRDIVLLIKHWGKVNTVCSKQRLSSYALTLMVIFFLQQTGYVPVLQELNVQKKLLQYRKFVFGKLQEFVYNAWYETDAEKIKAAISPEKIEKTSVLKLFQEFFEFYHNPEVYNTRIDISQLKRAPVIYKGDVFDICDPFDPEFRPGSRPFGLFDKRYVRGLFEQTYEFSQDQTTSNFSKIFNPRNQQNKQRFEVYMNKDELEEGIKSGEIFEGTFEGLGNAPVAFITSKHPKFKGLKIKIPNRSAQNRALHKDEVYFKLLSEDEHLEVHDDPTLHFTAQDHHHEQGTSQAKIVYAEILSVKTYHWSGKPIVGHVVKRDNFYDFEPLNKKLPKFAIRDRDQSFKDFLYDNGLRTNLSDIQTKYFSGKLLSWNSNSYSPLIELDKVLGDIDNIEVNCEILLDVNEVYNEPFKPETEAEMKQFHEFVKDGVYVIPESEQLKRKDFDLRQSHIICTIDPATARDLDDALSVTKLPNGLYEVGVHIADVSYFVREKTSVDEDASLRTTSVYLVHRVIAMLPRLLCEELCSLNPSQDRLAFSVFFQMKEDGEIIWDKNVRYGKSIIRSCAKFSYDIVQQIFDGKLTDLKTLPPQVGYDPKNVDEQTLIDCLKMLKTLGLNRRQKRLDSGALTFEKKKLRFQLDQHMIPVSFQVDERNQAMFVVEEFMLLANQLVAIKLVDTCRKLALLRNHPFPKEEKIGKFTDALAFYGKTVDFTNYQTLKKTLDEVMKNPQLDDGTKSNLQQTMIQILEQARYIIVEESEESTWHHFALNFSRYTHFTSPIRRYPDLLVHRLLEKALIYGPQMDKEVDSQYMIALMDSCNEKKMNSRRVSDGCEKIFMALYLKNHIKLTEGTIIELSQSNSSRYIKVFVKEYEIQVSLDFNNIKEIKNLKIVQDEKFPQFVKYIVTYLLQGQTTPQELVLSQFSKLEVIVTATDDFPIDYKLRIVLRDHEIPNKVFYLN